MGWFVGEEHFSVPGLHTTSSPLPLRASRPWREAGWIPTARLRIRAAPGNNSSALIRLPVWFTISKANEWRQTNFEAKRMNSDAGRNASALPGASFRHAHQQGVRLEVAVKTGRVAQNCILLYRGFSIRRLIELPTPSPSPTPCRMQFGDTADCKSALRLTATSNHTHQQARACSESWVRLRSRIPARYSLVVFLSPLDFTSCDRQTACSNREGKNRHGVATSPAPAPSAWHPVQPKEPMQMNCILTPARSNDHRPADGCCTLRALVDGGDPRTAPFNPP